MRVAIISNGDLGDIAKLKLELPLFDAVVCSDGGIRHLSDLGLYPDIIVGDFDSANQSLLDEYIKKGVVTKQFPKDKNETDTHLAVEIAIELGADSVYLLGAIGSRWDHSYANVMLLVRLAEQGIDARILHSHNHIFVSNNTLVLSAQPEQIISLLPLGNDVTIEATKGLKYPIYDQHLPLNFPIGISNVFTDTEAEVRIKSGWLMAVIAND